MPEYITELFTHVLSGAVGGLITLLLNHILSKDRDRTLKRETEIRAGKHQILPFIESIMRQIPKEEPVLVWRNQKSTLVNAASSFRVLLPERQQRRFDDIWRETETTKEEEMLDNGNFFRAEQTVERLAARELLMSRLTKLYEFIDGV